MPPVNVSHPLLCHPESVIKAIKTIKTINIINTTTVTATTTTTATTKTHLKWILRTEFNKLFRIYGQKLCPVFEKQLLFLMSLDLPATPNG
jgi:hypothetical protein